MRLETQFIRTFVLNCTKLRTSSNSHPPLCQPNVTKKGRFVRFESRIVRFANAFCEKSSTFVRKFEFVQHEGSCKSSVSLLTPTYRSFEQREIRTRRSRSSRN